MSRNIYQCGISNLFNFSCFGLITSIWLWPILSLHPAPRIVSFQLFIKTIFKNNISAVRLVPTKYSFIFVWCQYLLPLGGQTYIDQKMKHPSLLICSFSHLISEYISLAGESVELDNILFNHNCFENWLFYSECVEKPYSSIILNKIIFVMFYMNIYCILIFIVEFCTILVHYIYNFLFFSNCSYQSLFVNLNCLHS